MHSAKRQYKTADYEIKGDRNYNEGCRRRNESSGSKLIYQDSSGSSHKNRSERNPQITQPPTNDSTQVKWSRNNIALTMEYFQPISSTSTPKRYYNHSDYSYAYYEPGAVMRHSNIPKILTTDHQPNNQCNQSTRSSPKSIRSLLCNPADEKVKQMNRHMYTTRYGTQENIYEDVSSIRIKPRFESSDQCVSSEGPSKIEFKDTLHNHYRVLEELNLSLEELFLSTATKSNVRSPRKLLKVSTKHRPKVKACKNVFASSVNDLVIGEDSGFSGSSSGASYVGNLRNYKTALTRSHRNSTEINNFTNVSNYHTSQGLINVRVPDSYRNISQQMNQLKGDKRSSLLKGLKFPFWKKR